MQSSTGHQNRDNDDALVALLKIQLTHAFSPVWLDIRDDSAQHAGHPGAKSGRHFTVHIVSGKFTGQTRIASHRLVYAALANLMQSGIHALAISAHSPENWFAHSPDSVHPASCNSNSRSA